MKKILYFCLLLITIHPLSAQNNMDENLATLETFNNLFINEIETFLSNPEDHNNTVRLISRIEEINNIYLTEKNKGYSILTQTKNPKIIEYFKLVDQMQAIAATFIEFIRPINGNAGRGVPGPDMEILLEPLFEKAGWEKNMVNVVCKHAFFCEYSFKNFKIMFVKNTLPKSDYFNNHINTIVVDFTYANSYGAGGTYNVGGGLYRMIQFKDNNNNNYRKLLKATSRKDE